MTPQPRTATRAVRAGFTLIEALAVIALLGVLVAISFTTVPVSSTDLPADVERLKSHLRYAQTRAQADTYAWRVVFTGRNTYEIGPVVIPGAGFTASVVPGAGGTQGTLTDGVTTTSGTVIRFDSWGRPMNDSGALLSADQTITLTQGEETQNITILSNTGLIP